MGRKKPVEQVDGVDFRLVSHCLGKVGQTDQQEDEWNRREQRVESQGAGKKRNVVFISGGESGAGSRRATGATRRAWSRSGERLLEICG